VLNLSECSTQRECTFFWEKEGKVTARKVPKLSVSGTECLFISYNEAVWYVGGILRVGL
jgi:hypothetical protein